MKQTWRTPLLALYCTAVVVSLVACAGPGEQKAEPSVDINRELYFAIQRDRDHVKARHLLEQGAKPVENYVRRAVRFYWPPADQPAERSWRRKVVGLLLEHKAVDVNYNDGMGSALDYAILTKDSKLIELLFSYGANPNSKKDFMTSVASRLYRKGTYRNDPATRKEILDLLIVKGTKVSLDSGVLYRAVKFGASLEEIETLLIHGASAHHVNPSMGNRVRWCYPFSYTSVYKDDAESKVALLKLLLTYDKSLAKDGSVLSRAEKCRGSVEVVDAFRRNAAEAVARTDPGVIEGLEREDARRSSAEEALIAACGGQDPDLALIRSLLEKGADPNYISRTNACLEGLTHPGSFYGKPPEFTTPLLCALRGGSLELFELLLQHEADPNSIPLESTQKGRIISPLIVAIMSGSSLDIIEAFLRHGANVETDPEPLRRALERNDGAQIALLKKFHANPAVTDGGGNTALMYIGNVTDEGFVNWVVREVGDVNLMNRDRETPLIKAAGASDHEAAVRNISVLLSYGAEVNVRRVRGTNYSNRETALGYAARSRNIEALKLLLEHGAEIARHELEPMEYEVKRDKEKKAQDRDEELASIVKMVRYHVEKD